MSALAYLGLASGAVFAILVAWLVWDRKRLGSALESSRKAQDEAEVLARVSAEAAKAAQVAAKIARMKLREEYDYEAQKPTPKPATTTDAIDGLRKAFGEDDSNPS